MALIQPSTIQLGDEDTIQGRIQGIIAKNSPIQQQAVTRAKQASNAKGLLNTSMAVGDAQKAIYDYAVPIASQDAQTSFGAKQFNAGARNQFGMARLQGDIDKGLINTRGDVESRLMGEQYGYDTGARSQAADIESRLMGERFGYDTQGREQSADIESRLLGERAGYESLSRQEMGDIESRLQAERGDIQERLQNADAATRERLLNRQAEIDTEMAQLQSGLQSEARAQAADLESRLQAERGQIELDLQGADAATRERLLNRQAEIDSEMAELQNRFQTEGREQTADLESRLQSERAQLEQDLQLAIQNNDTANQERLLNRRGELDAEMAQLQADLVQKRDAILNDFQAQQNELERQFQGAENAEQRELAREEMLRNTAAELMRQVSGQNATLMDAIGQINSSDLGVNEKTQLIGRMAEMHLNNLQTTSAMNDFDIVDGEVVYRTQEGSPADTPASPTTLPNEVTSQLNDQQLQQVSAIERQIREYQNQIDSLENPNGLARPILEALIRNEQNKLSRITG